MIATDEDLLRLSQEDRERFSPACLNRIAALCGLEWRAPEPPPADDPDGALISVIVPTHNRRELLLRCVDSILEQTHRHVEAIVVDDASTDGTAGAVAARFGGEPRVRYLRNETSLGPGGARRRGYLASGGAFVVYIDDDDQYLEPRFFETALRAHREHPGCALVAGNTVTYSAEQRFCSFRPLNVTGFLPGRDYLLGFIRRYDKPSSSFPAVFRRSVLEQAGFAQMQMMNDASLYLRALCFGDAFLLPCVVGAYRVHGGNISRALPHGFLMDNLEEKANICRLAERRYGGDVRAWYREQVFSSVRYYFAGTKSTWRQKREVLRWCRRNCGSMMPLLLRAGFVRAFKLPRRLYWRLKLKALSAIRKGDAPHDPPGRSGS